MAVLQYYATGAGDARLRREFYATQLSDVSTRLHRAMKRDHDSIDALFAQVDRCGFDSHCVLLLLLLL